MAVAVDSSPDSALTPPAPNTAPLLWWTCGLLALWQVGGHIDAWYHVHRGFDIESFFTWPHALLYGAWAATGIVVLVHALANARRGLPRRAWLPPGYALILLGVALFGLGGAFDLVWHALFGFEVRLETLLSPAHLWLVVASGLALFGFLRAAVEHRRQSGAHGYRPALADIPLVLVVALLFRLALWSLFYSEPLAADYASGGVGIARLGTSQGFALQADVARVAGVTGLLLHSVLLALFLVAPLWRLRLPGGTIALLMLWDGLLIVAVTDMWLYLPAVIGAALVGEALWAWMWRGGLDGVNAEPGYWLLAFSVPLVEFGFYFVLMAAFGGGIIWTVHLVLGAPVLAAFYGLLTGLLAVPPRFLRAAVG
jgi:hypothetical protein